MAKIITSTNEDLNSPYKDIDHYKLSLSSFTQEINSLFSLIEKRYNIWSQSKEKLNELHQINKEGICTLDISGTLFQTSLYTLKKVHGTLFYNQILAKEIANGQTTFYDRDPSLFHILLNYLRTLTLPDLAFISAEEKSQLIIEAEYYSITPLVNKLKGSNNLFRPPLEIQSVLIEGSNYHLIKGDNKNTILNSNDNEKGILMKDIGALTIKFNQVADYKSFDIRGFDLDSIPFMLRQKWNCLNEENEDNNNHDHGHDKPKEITVLSSIDNENWIKIATLPLIYNDLLITVKFAKAQGQYIKFCLENALFHISYFKLNQIK